ncbi:MAG: hypothetical protein EOM70_09065 [Clostridia bacterium]|nr:hypothetical protein [Clostridia bacterium]
MSNLINQINEMIDILEAINPAAAAQFRSGGPGRDSEPPQPAPVTARIQTSVQPRAKVTEAIQTPAFVPRQLKLNLNPGQMAEAIILAEIIGKPVSKRRR